MSRWEFMRQLEELLSDISPNEREEALQYYNDYFNDAGRENEQEVIDALGSPGQVAQIVREGLDDGGSQGEFTENGFSSGRSSLENELIKRERASDGRSGGESTRESAFDQGSAEKGQENGSTFGGRNAERDRAFSGTRSESQDQDAGTYAGETADSQSDGSFHQSGGGFWKDTASRARKELPVWAIVLIILGLILASPVIFGAALSLLGTVLGLICAVLGIIFGLGLATVILFVVAISLVVAGFGCMIAHPLTGVGLIGGGCICAALGLLFLLCVVFLVGKGIPAIWQGMTYLYHKIFEGRKGAAA